jgi:hypothetical protein
LWLHRKRAGRNGGKHRKGARFTCRSPANSTASHLLISCCAPSVASYLVESTFSGGFDSRTLPRQFPAPTFLQSSLNRVTRAALSDLGPFMGTKLRRSEGQQGRLEDCALRNTDLRSLMCTRHAVLTRTPVTSVIPAPSTVVSATDEPLCELTF